MSTLFTAYAFLTADGSANRTLPARLSDIANVKDYGATGDGVTDDLPAILAAYNRGRVILTTTTPNNQTASFTGKISLAHFTGSISGPTLSVSGLTGTIAIGHSIGPSLVNLAPGTRIVSGSGSTWVVSGAPFAIGPIEMATDTARFTGTVTTSGGTNTMTITGLVGTIGFDQFIYDGVFPNTIITAGSVSTWTVAVSHNVPSQAMATDTVLSASSVVGTIHTAVSLGASRGDGVVGAGFAGVNVARQTTGTAGSDGVYPVNFPAGSTLFDQNIASEPMITTTGVLTFASVPSSVTAGMFAVDLTDSAAFVASSLNVQAVSSTTTTFNSIEGLVEVGDQISFNQTNRGVLYFPPGTYYVSGPIDLGPTGEDVHGMVFINLLGDDQGSTTIVGDFADYVISRGVTNNGNSFSGGFEVEKLKIVNGHAEGGGIRIGLAVGGAIRDCDITANFGITTLNQDALIVEGSGSSYSASLEVSIINCNLRAYDDLTGDYTTGSGAIPLSIGIAKTADGPTTNCTFKDYNVAFTGFAGEGCMAVQGCYFEHNNYGMTSNWGPGRILNDGPTATSGINVSGCRFKNNGIAILSAAGISTYRGCSIEASEGTIAGQPQHGVYAGAGGSCVFAGMRITGQYQQAGFALVGGETSRCTVEGIAVSNTSTLGGVTWTMPSTASSGVFRGCNTAAVYTMGQLPAPSLDMRSIGWSSGTTTIDLLHDMGAYIGRTVTVAVSGVTPSGYNGAFTGGTVLDGSHVSYAQSNPGSPTGTTGKAVVNVGTNARQGELYNVSDADASTWGVTTAGAGSTHAKVRWSATNWTVIGK